MPFPVDTKYILEAEEKLGVRFPSSFHTGMSQLNGGEVDTQSGLWKLFPVFDTSDKKRIRRTANNIVRETASAKDWTVFPQSAIAIAANGNGDLALMMPSDENPSLLQDMVYFLSHETGEMRILSPTVEIWLQSRS